MWTQNCIYTYPNMFEIHENFLYQHRYFLRFNGPWVCAMSALVPFLSPSGLSQWPALCRGSSQSKEAQTERRLGEGLASHGWRPNSSQAVGHNTSGHNSTGHNSRRHYSIDHFSTAYHSIVHYRTTITV